MLSALHKTDGKDDKQLISCTIEAIMKPASATSLKDNVSDANGLFVTLLIFFDYQLVGATILFFPNRKTTYVPCEAPFGKLS